MTNTVTFSYPELTIQLSAETIAIQSEQDDTYHHPVQVTPGQLSEIYRVYRELWGEKC